MALAAFNQRENRPSRASFVILTVASTNARERETRVARNRATDCSCINVDRELTRFLAATNLLVRVKSPTGRVDSSRSLHFDRTPGSTRPRRYIAARLAVPPREREDKMIIRRDVALCGFSADRRARSAARGHVPRHNAL